MSRFTFCNIEAPAVAAALLGCLLLAGGAGARVAEEEVKRPPAPAAATDAPGGGDAALLPRPQGHQCFHMSREHCPVGTVHCARVDPRSVFCCNVDSFSLQEGLAAIPMGQNTSYLHILNATLDELDFSQTAYRRLTQLTHLAVTDGRVGRIVGQFSRMSPLTCLNISNNGLTSSGLNASSRHFAYLMNLTVLDVSANNLTEFPTNLFSISRKIAVDLSGNNNTLCREYEKVMEGNNSQLTFLNDNKTFCVISLLFHWFNESQFVPIETVRIQKEINASCRKIKPTPLCVCTPERYEFFKEEVITAVSVECTNLHLKELPTNLPPNTVTLNVSYNNITSLAAVADDPTYERLRRLFIDHNDVPSLIELEGTRFIDNFVTFSIQANKLKTIQTYILSRTFDYSPQKRFLISKNQIHCDCNTDKVIKTWLIENAKNIPDLPELECDNGMGHVINLIESRVCQQQRNWTDYIYYIIGAEVATLILLVSKVSYDYWVFKTQGFLPWPANKMPRLPCDWLCE